MTISNKTYDVLKFVSLVLLPASAALYLGLGEVWSWPNTAQVGTSIVLIDTFLGAVLQLNSSKYKNQIDGYLAVTGHDEDTGIPELRMVVTTPPDDLQVGSVARLKVGSPPAH